jgi:hypothetical protein
MSSTCFPRGHLHRPRPQDRDRRRPADPGGRPGSDRAREAEQTPGGPARLIIDSGDSAATTAAGSDPDRSHGILTAVPGARHPVTPAREQLLIHRQAQETVPVYTPSARPSSLSRRGGIRPVPHKGQNSGSGETTARATTTGNPGGDPPPAPAPARAAGAPRVRGPARHRPVTSSGVRPRAGRGPFRRTSHAADDTHLPDGRRTGQGARFGTEKARLSHTTARDAHPTGQVPGRGVRRLPRDLGFRR